MIIRIWVQACLLTAILLFPLRSIGLQNDLVMGTVTGARSRNTSLRTAAANLNFESDSFPCDYCDLETCTARKRTSRSSGREVFCFSKRSVNEDENAEPTSTCITDEAELRYLVLAERLKDSNTCQPAKEDPNLRICWCKESLRRSLSRVEQLQERSRLRFATGTKGGIKLVHYQSVDQKQVTQNYENIVKSPQTLRQGPRVQASGLQRSGSTVPPTPQDFHSRHKIASTHGGIAGRPTNPRRPSSSPFTDSASLSRPSVVALSSVMIIYYLRLL
ncbi:unnamed protein product [Bursaphelenchus xylophilus]|uniref:(pine wood nematode) hypothetical protein n=1 Tax=Bursaphelenchus xylophilus TaxID=6326 RepID=A0A1I7RYN0_BURXY|nr:unnamed protein product [Bursaphelenchus xylophilus]CAG9092496.1 unnamed protein product [Bursaphelenchus xylophilus]